MRLPDIERAAFLDAHPEWELDSESLRRTFAFADFGTAIGFVVRLAFLAEAADHHPDIDVRWNKVTIVLSTHSEHALTVKDTALAEKIEALLA